MSEKFIFSFNGVNIENPITMAEAIDIARKKAIAGRTTRLRIGNILLGTYAPNPASPITFTHPLTHETKKVECCLVDCVLPKNEY